VYPRLKFTATQFIPPRWTEALSSAEVRNVHYKSLKDRSSLRLHSYHSADSPTRNNAFEPLLVPLRRRERDSGTQGRSQPFCVRGFLVHIACPNDNRAPEALFTKGVRGHGPPENFWILGLQKWRFLDSERKFQIISEPNVASISKRRL